MNAKGSREIAHILSLSVISLATLALLASCKLEEPGAGGPGGVTRYDLNTALSGNGTISSIPTGISCESDCTESYASGTQVALLAAPANGYVFDGWSGACSGTTSCSVAMTTDRTINATFSVAAPGTSQLVVSTTSGGSVTSNPSGIDCGSDCTHSYPDGTTVTLTAVPAVDYSFVGWSGACSGNGSCSVDLTQNRVVTAFFSSGNVANLCDGLITDTANHPMTALSKPAVGSAVTDPEFGTTIRRVSGAQTGAVIKPMYSTVQGWNANESYLILYHTGGSNSGHHLYDGKTYAHIKSLDIDPPDLEQVFWHTSDPDLLHYVDNNYNSGSSVDPTLIRYHVSTDTKDPIKTFASCDRVTSGSDPMFTSADSDVFGLLCEQGSSRLRFSYRISTNTEGPKIATSGYEGPQPSASGNLFFFAGDGNADIVNFNGVYQRTLDLGSPYEHASLGSLLDGSDMYFGIDFDGGSSCGSGSLVAHNMSNGTCNVVVGPSTGYPYPPSGTHVSAIAYQKPGWVGVSMVGYNYDGQSVLDNEIILANANPGGSVCRVAHHRSHGKDGPRGYWAEPHVSISPSGTRMIFGSDWGGGNTVDTYVVELPSYQP